jgi:protein-tyrosine phosphatase
MYERIFDTEDSIIESYTPDVMIYHFNMITDYVAIGDVSSSYDSFNVIVNLAFPTNGAPHLGIVDSDVNGKRIINIGIYDSPDEPMLDILKDVMPRLMELPNDTPILFHCHAGISRSTTIATAYLSKRFGLTLNQTLDFIRSKRHIIQPNPGFIKALDAFLNQD